jgi:hypothetical protein
MHRFQCARVEQASADGRLVRDDGQAQPDLAQSPHCASGAW